MEKDSKEEPYYEKVIKKTKTGMTIPKELREEMFEEDHDYYFHLIVPKERDKLILKILDEQEAESLGEKIDATPIRSSSSPKKKKKKKGKSKVSEMNWGDIFVYDFDAQEKVKPILESAFLKFSQEPLNLEDAMGRIKYALVSFLSSRKTDNAKLYFSVEKFLIEIIRRFDLPNLIDFIFEKIIPNIKSKFLYELALLELVGIALDKKRFDKAHTYIFHVLKNIDEYPKTQMYNIMNSFKQLVKKVKHVERTKTIDILLKEKLMEYGEGVEDSDYKIQIVEFLEDLNYIQLAYDLAKEIQVSLPPDSLKLDEVRKLVRRLHTTPITQDKSNH
mgnify:CR=1 FL=1